MIVTTIITDDLTVFQLNTIAALIDTAAKGRSVLLNVSQSMANKISAKFENVVDIRKHSHLALNLIKRTLTNKEFISNYPFIETDAECMLVVTDEDVSCLKEQMMRLHQLPVYSLLNERDMVDAMSYISSLPALV